MTISDTAQQASLLRALADHMAICPDLPKLASVSLTMTWLQISGGADERGAQAVLQWAHTLGDPVLWIRKHADSTHNTVEVHTFGAIDEHRIEVWDIDTGDLHRWLGPERDTPITPDQLATYVATGSTEVAQ